MSCCANWFLIRQFKLEIRYGNHQEIPLISSSLDVFIEKSGNYQNHMIYTKKELLRGDIISTEKPFCTILNDNYSKICCENCNKVLIPLIPCANYNLSLYWLYWKLYERSIW